MLTQILMLLLTTVASLLSMALLARVWMLFMRISFYNPLGQFILALTDWLIKPTRRSIPFFRGIDLASLLAAWLVQFLYLGAVASLLGYSAFDPQYLLALFSLAAITTLRLLVYLLMGVIIIAAVISWVNPYSSFAALFDTLSRPLLAPIRRFIPLIGGIDLSPLVVLLLLNMLLIVLNGFSLQLRGIHALPLPM